MLGVEIDCFKSAIEALVVESAIAMESDAQLSGGGDDRHVGATVSGKEGEKEKK